MSNNVFRKYNKLLLTEKFYELKYNPSKKAKIKQKIIPLLYALKNNDDNYDNSQLKGNDSVSTIEAMNNPYMNKFSNFMYSKNEQNELMKNLSPIKSKSNKSRKHSNVINTFNKTNSNKICISEYAECLKNYGHKKSNNFSIFSKNKSNYFFEKIHLMEKKFKSKVKNIIPKKCYFCSIIATERNKKEEYYSKTERNLSDYKKFIKVLKKFPERKIDDKSLTSRKIIIENKNNIDMESELTKNKNKIKYKEIKRIEFDTKNLFHIKKPLIPSIRAKIFKNMKKRPHKPVRSVISCTHYSNLFNKF